MSITLNDERTTIIGATRFFSTFGVYNISGMQILTLPGAEDIIMTVEAEDRAIKTKGELYKLEYELQIRACIAGEE